MHRFLPILAALLWACTASPATPDAADTATDAATTDDAAVLPDGNPTDAWTTCPTGVGASGAPCVGNLSCQFGQECCCGSCSYSSKCQCVNGQFACMYSDYCMGGGNCSGGCSSGQFQTTTGCKSCMAIVATIDAGITAVLAAEPTCATDAECTVWTPKAACVGTCQRAAPKSGLVKIQAAEAKLVQDNCSGKAAYCANSYGCAAGAPACLAGACVLLEPCDGIKMPLGAACDDGNACTTKDVCVAKGQCQGSALSCDDGDPCTIDSCSPTKGCATAPSTGAKCPSVGSCALGASCQAGKCVDSDVKGWVQTYPEPVETYVAALAVHPAGGFVLASNGPATGTQQARVWRVGVDGKLLWSVTPAIALAVSTSAIAATADGGVLLAGNAWDNSSGPAQVFLARLDAAGQLVWKVSYEVGNPLPGGGLAILPSGAALAVRISVANSEPIVHVLRVDPAGKLVQDIALGKSAGAGGPRLVSSGADLALLETAIDATPQGSLGDARFVRITDNGTIAVDVTLHEDGNDFPSDIVALPDGGFVLAGWRILYDGTGKKSDTGWMRRIEADGKTGWSMTLPTAWRATWDGDAVAVLTAGNYSAAGVQVLRYLPTGAAAGELALPPSALPGTAAAFARDAAGYVLAGTTNMAAQAWLTRAFAPCPAGGCAMPGCP